jgi:hypothetical protein
LFKCNTRKYNKVYDEFSIDALYKKNIHDDDISDYLNYELMEYIIYLIEMP